MYAQTPCILTDTTFREIISLQNANIIVRDQVTDTAGTAVLMGDTSASSIRVALINLKGQVAWNSRFSFDGETAVTFTGNNIVPARDGYYISFLAYQAERDYSVFIGKISKQGKGLWFRKMSFDKTLVNDAEFFTSNLTLATITPLEDGVLVSLSDRASAHINGVGYENIVATAQMDASGKLLWNASFLSDYEQPSMCGIYPDIRSNSFAVLSTLYGYSSFLNFRFNPYEKNIFYIKSYAGYLPSGTSTLHFFSPGGQQAAQLKNNSFVVSYRSHNPEINSSLWANFDTALTYTSAFTVKNDASGYFGHSADCRITEDGKIIYHTRYGSNTKDSLYSNIALINIAGNKIKEYKFTNSKVLQSWKFGFIGNSYDSVIGASTAIENGKYKLEYFNIGGGGNLNNDYCETYPSNDIKVEPHQLTEFTFKWDLVRYDLWKSTPLVFTETEEQFERQIQCSKVITCDAVKITGPTETCDIMPLTYTIHRTPGCAKPLQWLVDSSKAVIMTYLTDSSILLLPKVYGTISIIGKFLECDNVRDTIKLLVAATSDYIDLGNDTTICTGATLALDAGAGFTNYKWQRGESTRSITINEAGKYWVQAEGSCGQLLSDTIIVLQDSISVQAPGSSAVCKGDSIAILPLATGAVTSVLWQPAIGINNPQLLDVVIKIAADIQYTVNVISANNCLAADSIKIKAWPLPEKFLLPDYAVCLNDSIKVQPLKSYPNYHWSDGTKESSFATEFLGNYWLRVKDKNGCEATEYFTIKELDCDNTIYFPSAFSPNNDKLNDWFRPIVKGNLQALYFSVYNRWGQLVFESNDSGGWDGNFKGRQQEVGLYIWQCNYQFIGRERKSVSGNVTLVR